MSKKSYLVDFVSIFWEEMFDVQRIKVKKLLLINVLLIHGEEWTSEKRKLNTFLILLYTFERFLN